MSRLHGKMRPRLTGLPYLVDRATRLGGLPHLSCKHDQVKIRDYMEMRVTPPRRVTSPTWGPPPPCKQALILRWKTSKDSLHVLNWLSLACRRTLHKCILVFKCLNNLVPKYLNQVFFLQGIGLKHGAILYNEAEVFSPSITNPNGRANAPI